MPAIDGFLRQSVDDQVPAATTEAALVELVAAGAFDQT